LKPDHILITGDVTTSGDSIEYEQVTDILRSLDFYDKDRLTVIPGNHDLYPCMYSHISDIEDELGSIRRVPEFLKKVYRIYNELSNYTYDDYSNALKKFNTYFGALYSGSHSLGNDDNGGFPYIKILNDKVALICIDSNYVSPVASLRGLVSLGTMGNLFTRNWDTLLYKISDNPLCSNGWVDTQLLDKALNAKVIKNKHKFVLMHHYLYSQTIVDEYMGYPFSEVMAILESSRKKIISTCIKSKVDIVLHGHWHITEEYWLKNHSLHILNGGGFWDGGYNIIEVDKTIRVNA